MARTDASSRDSAQQEEESSGTDAGFDTRDAEREAGPPVSNPPDAGAEPSADAAVSRPDAGREPVVDASTQTPDAGNEQPTGKVIAGSAEAANCSSYGLPSAAMCGGHYCGVTVEDLESSYNPGGKCDTAPQALCAGQLFRDAMKCARDTKSDPLNALDSDAMIRSKTQTCILNIPANSGTAPNCLGCFLDAEDCATAKCLTQCLSGNSASCDTCRLANNCDQSIPLCAGFPTPF